MTFFVAHTLTENACLRRTRREIDIGERSPAVTTVRTGPYTAVRWMKLPARNQGRNPERSKIGVGQRESKGRAVRRLPRAVGTASRFSGQTLSHSAFRSSANRLLLCFHCFQIADRSRRLVHSSAVAMPAWRVSLKEHHEGYLPEDLPFVSNSKLSMEQTCSVHSRNGEEAKLPPRSKKADRPATRFSCRQGRKFRQRSQRQRSSPP